MVSYPAALADTEAPEPRSGSTDMLARGTLVNRYVILERLGAGGMGVVYAAYDPDLRRRVALKFLLASGSDVEMGVQQARLLREAQAIARLSHPNVVSVFDAGTFGDQVFVAMEYVDGQTLRAWCQSEVRGWQQILAVFLSAARGLSAAHAAGLVHRDFKPENVLIGKDERVRVLDFGLARPSDLNVSGLIASRDSIMVSEGDALKLSLTRSGVLAGTPAYMSPEQFLDAQANARSDQFSFCVALYELLYGQRPFGGDNVVELINNVTTGKMRLPPRGSSVPTRIRRVILRGLAGTPSRRHASMDALIRAFEAARGGRIFGWLLLASLGVTCVAMLSFVLLFAGTGNEFCHAAAERTAASWGMQQRLAVGHNFVATRQVYAIDSFSHVDAILTRYAGALRDTHIQVCDSPEHERSPERLAGQMQCIDLRHQALTQLVELLAESPDVQVVEHAIEASHHLPPVAPCAGVTMQPVALAEVPIVQAETDALRTQIVRASTLAELGLHTRAENDLAALEPRIRELGVRPLTAELQVARMQLLAGLGDDDAVYTTARAALDDAVASGRDDLAVRALRYLHVVAGLKRGHYEEAEIWAAQALAFLDRLGSSGEHERAVMHLDAAAIWERRGRLVESRTIIEETLATLHRIDTPDPAIVVAAQTGLARVLLRLGEAGQAIAELDRALTLNEASFGPSHPSNAAVYQQRGRALAHSGSTEAAIREFRTALALRTAAGGEPLGLVTLRSDLAAALFEHGQLDEARLMAMAALSEPDSIMTRDHPVRVSALLILWRVARAESKFAEARVYLDEALGIAAAKGTLQDPEVAEVHADLASVALLAGDLDAAESHATLALPGLTKTSDMAAALAGLQETIRAIQSARQRSLKNTGRPSPARSVP